ncbi:hypothetical protein [Chryseobacterium sp. MA9]|uniref:hypothetical protein n=1 Tax=Chryseobacterium sp. MA9 TaxID=2966625 RepID=UPI002107C810|nr:hypothetical protein [Chryseobacterium sp. MA9]UTX48100.1 hypothetical protein KIK00_19625 [Chryseobacterium sp. MA9]
MKNFKKILKLQLKEVHGGVLPGMKRCVDEVTCQLRIWWIGGGPGSTCTHAYPFCAPEEYYPPETEDLGTIHEA